jgi:hypothetical protein
MDAWVIIDWSNHGLQVDCVPKRFIDGMIVGVNDRGGCFIEVDVARQSRRRFPPVALYCVTAVKDLVGLRDWRVVTPFQLYSALMKRGGKRMFDLSHIKETAGGESIQKTKSAPTGQRA